MCRNCYKKNKCRNAFVGSICKNKDLFKEKRILKDREGFVRLINSMNKDEFYLEILPNSEDMVLLLPNTEAHYLYQGSFRLVNYNDEHLVRNKRFTYREVGEDYYACIRD